MSGADAGGGGPVAEAGGPDTDDRPRVPDSSVGTVLDSDDRHGRNGSDGTGGRGDRGDGADGAGLPPGPTGPSRRRRRPLRTSLIVLAATAVAGAGGIAATGALGGDGAGPSAADPSGPARTATVEKRTLTRGETVDGTLGYGEASAVQAGAGGASEPAGEGGANDANAAAPGSGSSTGSEGGSSTAPEGGNSTASGGTLTWLPAEGQQIERGETVYSADEKKVPLLYGATPLYRTLDVGAEGDDVETLEKNLAALGHTGFTVDEEYSAGTAEAVKDWQEDLGREETGEVAPGDAVVASGARRVAEVKSSRGNAASGEVLTWTGTARKVTVDLEAQYEDLVEEGTKATVALPDGTEAEARVTDVGNAATAKPSEDGGDSPGGADGATLPVELTVKDQKKLGRYQAAPVDVTLAAESREDVLAVPVGALVARRGGGYAVQAVTGSGVEYRPVELGMFANGMVEVSGDGITEGLKVGVPK
ncbi:peptidoglycan-binding protein [Streptomyces aureoverticillatus]|nr:peptidoglycan-binding protein [Streptomyces aureoverticillatus]